MKNLCFFFLLIFTVFACSEEKILVTENSELSIVEVQENAFHSTIERLQKEYPYTIESSRRRDQSLCGSQSDPLVNCDEAVIVSISLPIDGTGEIYHPTLPPMECGLNITMDIRFCRGVTFNNSIVTFENFDIVGFVEPISEECFAWLDAWNNLPPSTRNQAFRDVTSDYQIAYENNFMNQWASSPINEFNSCGDDNPCSPEFAAIQAKYYKASCTKICLVFEIECEDTFGFLCRKEIPCFEDGCCKRQTTYCYNEDTGEAEICQGPTYNIIEGCTIDIEEDPCVVQLESCRDTPTCEG